MRWVKLIALAVLAEAVLIVCAVVYMLIYSARIHPGETAVFYDEQARLLLPWVAVAVAFPVFYWLSQYAGGWRPAIVFWGIHIAIDVAFTAATDGIGALAGILPLWAASQALKLAGCWFGSRRAAGA